MAYIHPHRVRAAAEKPKSLQATEVASGFEEFVGRRVTLTNNGAMVTGTYQGTRAFGRLVMHVIRSEYVPPLTSSTSYIRAWELDGFTVHDDA